MIMILKSEWNINKTCLRKRAYYEKNGDIITEVIDAEYVYTVTSPFLGWTYDGHSTYQNKIKFNAYQELETPEDFFDWMKDYEEDNDFFRDLHSYMLDKTLEKKEHKKERTKI